MSDNGLLIRLAKESDMPAVYELMAELGYPDLSPSRFAATYDSVLKHPAMKVIIGEAEDGSIAGMASVTVRPQLRLTASLITIDELVVASGSRGRGVGRALLDHVKAMADDSKAGRLELETNRARESYRRGFYIKNGFAEANSAVMRIDYEVR